MRFTAVVSVLFGAGALACAIVIGRDWGTTANTWSASVGMVACAFVSGFFLKGWGRQEREEELLPVIPQGTQLNIRGMAEVAVDVPSFVRRPVYLVEFCLDTGWQSRIVTAQHFGPMGLRSQASRGELAIGTQLIQGANGLTLAPQ